MATRAALTASTGNLVGDDQNSITVGRAAQKYAKAKVLLIRSSEWEGG